MNDEREKGLSFVFSLTADDLSIRTLLSKLRWSEQPQFGEAERVYF